MWAETATAVAVAVVLCANRLSTSRAFFYVVAAALGVAVCLFLVATRLPESVRWTAATAYVVANAGVAYSVFWRLVPLPAVAVYVGASALAGASVAHVWLRAVDLAHSTVSDVAFVWLVACGALVAFAVDVCVLDADQLVAGTCVALVVAFVVAQRVGVSIVRSVALALVFGAAVAVAAAFSAATFDADALRKMLLLIPSVGTGTGDGPGPTLREAINDAMDAIVQFVAGISILDHPDTAKQILTTHVPLCLLLFVLGNLWRARRAHVEADEEADEEEDDDKNVSAAAAARWEETDATREYMARLARSQPFREWVAENAHRLVVVEPQRNA